MDIKKIISLINLCIIVASIQCYGANDTDKKTKLPTAQSMPHIALIEPEPPVGRCCLCCFYWKNKPKSTDFAPSLKVDIENLGPSPFGSPSQSLYQPNNSPRESEENNDDDDDDSDGAGVGSLKQKEKD